jgi:Uncharacterised nucleotidyltransferase
VRECLYLGRDTEQIERSLRELEAIESATFYRYIDAYEFQLGPLLFWHLKRRSLTGRLTKGIRGELEKRYRRNLARNCLLQQGLERIIGSLAREGIDVLILKGASAFTSDLLLFRDAFVLFDIDLLVRPPEIEDATRILLSIGCVPTDSQSLDGHVKRGFLAADNFTRIDLHSALFWTTGIRYRDYGPDDLWETSSISSIAGWPVRVLSGEGQVCSRLIHDGIAYGTSALLSSTSRLYYFCALIDFYRNAIDWTRLVGRRQGSSVDRLLIAYMRFGSRELGLEIPEELKSLGRQNNRDLRLLDAVADSSNRLVVYCNRTLLAVLTASTARIRLKTLYQSFYVDLVQRRRKQDASATASQRSLLLLKMVVLQLVAILYVGMYTLRRSSLGVRVHAG